MNNIHPSEKEIQRYALDKSDVDPETIVHIESCASCRSEATTYQMLFSELKDQPPVSFDFDLQKLVLARLPKTNTGLSIDDIIAGFLVFFTCACICIPVYVFRKIILNSFSDIPPFFIYSIVIGTASILTVKILSIYKKFRNQMHLLNIH